MASSYKSEYPALDLDPAYKAFFEEFYKVSDTPDLHEHYTTFYTPDATLIMASKKVVGTKGSDISIPIPICTTIPTYHHFQLRSQSRYHRPLHEFCNAMHTNPIIEILALRTSMWEKVASRSHRPIKIFPFGSNSDEVMLYGTVKYGLKAGGESGLDWAARAHLVKDGEGKVRMDYYQVYLVSIYISYFAFKGRGGREICVDRELT